RLDPRSPARRRGRILRAVRGAGSRRDRNGDGRGDHGIRFQGHPAAVRTKSRAALIWHIACSAFVTEGFLMLWTIFVILLVLWALGLVSSYALGGYIHLLLVVAIVVVLIRIIQGRRPI